MSWSHEDAEKPQLHDAVISKLKQARADQETKPGSNASSRAATVTSKDWVPNYQQHNYPLSIDVEFDTLFDEAQLPGGLHRSISSSKALQVAVEAVPDKMLSKYLSEFDTIFPNQSPALTNNEPALTPSVAHDAAADEQPMVSSETPSLVDAPTGSSPKKKTRRRKARKPEVKEYIEGNPTDIDVLLGRGGKSNHHPGNKRYRSEVQNLQSWYKSSPKTEKTDLSQHIVDYVHSYGGRFVQKNSASGKWFIVPNIKARKKASQALRELKTAEERELMKLQKAAMESS